MNTYSSYSLSLLTEVKSRNITKMGFRLASMLNRSDELVIAPQTPDILS